MKKLIFVFAIFYHVFSFSQDTTQVKHTQKINTLLDKVNVINNKHLNNKEQVINKSKIDDLMLKIETINKVDSSSSVEVNVDSLTTIINFLKSSNRQKDSLIASLKLQLEKEKNNTQKANISDKQKKSYNYHYIVLGAYQFKANAEKQATKLHNYQVEIIPAYANKLHYVVYKLKPKEKIDATLNKFRLQVAEDAWYIAL